MSSSTKKKLFYVFILLNVGLLIYAWRQEEFLNPEMLKALLTGENFLTSYLVYILVLIIRGLTLIPGTAFLIAGIYVFTPAQVFIAIQIAIFCYCLIIYNFAHKLNFKIPQKIIDYEEKIKNKEIPIIFALCFIPGISINVLIYFLSIINIRLRSILIGIIVGTSITSTIYIFLIKSAFEGASLVGSSTGLTN